MLAIVALGRGAPYVQSEEYEAFPFDPPLSHSGHIVEGRYPSPPPNMKRMAYRLHGIFTRFAVIIKDGMGTVNRREEDVWY